jgi:hypothetical protein
MKYNNYRYIFHSIRPDIRQFLVSGIRPDIQQVKSGMWPYTGYQKGRMSDRPDIWCVPCSGFTTKKTTGIKNRGRNKKGRPLLPTLTMTDCINHINHGSKKGKNFQ